MFLSSLCFSDTNFVQRMALLNRLEKDLIAAEHFANYAWAVARLKIEYPANKGGKS